MIDIDYQKALDFEHIENINEARNKLSQLTTLLNRVLIIRQNSKKEILESCSKYKGERLEKLSWDNKLLKLAELSGSSELVNLWQEADSAYRQIRHKHSQVMEDLLVLKKQIDFIPR